MVRLGGGDVVLGMLPDRPGAVLESRLGVVEGGVLGSEFDPDMCLVLSAYGPNIWDGDSIQRVELDYVCMRIGSSNDLLVLVGLGGIRIRSPEGGCRAKRAS